MGGGKLFLYLRRASNCGVEHHSRCGGRGDVSEPQSVQAVTRPDGKGGGSERGRRDEEENASCQGGGVDTEAQVENA